MEAPPKDGTDLISTIGEEREENGSCGAPMNTMLDVALDCIRRGWHVFPCVPGDKVPLKGVSGYLDASNDEAQVRAWWERQPNANIGIATAKSGLIVVDIDTGLSREDDLRAYTAAHDIPLTFVVRTGRRPEYRVQLYFSGTGAPSFNGWKHEEGHSGDVRGSTWGHVIAAGCLHPSGSRYEVLWDLPIAPVPNWARALKQAVEERPALADPTAPIVDWRNDTLYRVLCGLRAKGADDEMVRDFALRKQAQMPNPLGEEELETVIRNACKQPIGAPEPVPVLGGRPTAGIVDTEDAEELAPSTRPLYPDKEWDGTAYGEFAELCTRDNYIPKKFFIEALRTVTGALVGNRLRCPITGVNTRAYTIIIGPPSCGKGTTVDRLQELFCGERWDGLERTEAPLLWADPAELCWRSRGIGAQIITPASAPGLMKAILPRKLKKNESYNPLELWKPIPRVITIAEEVRTVFANFDNESTGAGLESVMCELFDRDSFTTTVTKDRGPEAGRLMYSVFGGITREGWDGIFSKAQSVESGFLSRINIIGTEEERRKGKLRRPNFESLRNTFFPLIQALEKNPRTLDATPDADALIDRWFAELTMPEGVSKARLNIHAWRTALHLAWLRGHDHINAVDAESAIRVTSYQVLMREFYAPAEGETRQARCEAAIRKAMRAKRRMTERACKKATHYERYGVDLWTRSLIALCKAEELRWDKEARPRMIILLKAKD